MSPTIFRDGSLRFYFFNGEAKFWVEPNIELAQNYGLTARQVNSALRAIGEHVNEIRAAWAAHFG